MTSERTWAGAQALESLATMRGLSQLFSLMYQYLNDAKFLFTFHLLDGCSEKIIFSFSLGFWMVKKELCVVQDGCRKSGSWNK